MRKLMAIALVLAIVSGISFQAFKQSSHPVQDTHKLLVVATFYPLAELAQQIGGDKVEVRNLTPAGSEPHDYEPTPQDVIAIHASDVFVYNGAGLELWLNKIGDLDAKNPIQVNASQGIQLLGKSDPHIWMDPVLAQQELNNLLAGFIQADPTNEAFYRQNAQIYKESLQKLDIDFRTGLAHCQLRDIVTSHNAFAYLANEYHLNVLAISGLSPDEEPTPQKLGEVAQFVKLHHVQYIFFESLVSPKLSQTIASETGAQILAFNPLEGLTPEELSAGKNYLSVQQSNLQALRTALVCQ